MSEIHVAGMPSVWSVLQKMKDMHDWEDYPFPYISHWMEARDLCWIVECMKHLDDGPALFSGGKWATIQNLQALIDREASAAVRKKERP
jgi:hypothetical protein